MGKIPEDWRAARLVDVADYINGYAFSPEDWKSEGLPIIRIQNLNDPNVEFNHFDGEIDDRYIVEDADLLFAWSASIGVYIWNRGRAVLNQHIFKVIPKEKIDRHFLYYALFVGTEQLENRVHGSTMKHFKRGELKMAYVPLPPVEEQEGIVGVLGVVDSAIELVDRVIWKTERLKKGLMQTLLTRGIGHKEFKDTEIGKIPEEWKVFKLRDVCYKIQDGTHFSPKPQPAGVPYVTSKNIRSWGIDLTDIICVAPKDHLEIFKRCDPKLGDLLYVKDGVNTGTVTVNTLAYEFTLLSSVAMIRPNPDFLEPWFLKYALDSPNLKKRHLGVMTGTAIRRLTLDRIKNLKVPVPNMAEQRKISEILSTIDTKSRLEDKKKAKLQRIRRGLMDLLLTGKVRVKVD